MVSSRIMALVAIIFFLVVSGEAQLQVPKSNNENMREVGKKGYKYVATVYMNKDPVTWKGECFQENSGILRVGQFLQPTANVYITPHNGKTWTCKDYYEIRLQGKAVAWTSAYFGNHQVVARVSIEEESRKNSVLKNGLQVYVWNSESYNANDDVSKKQIDNLSEDA